jgi:ribosome-associated protein
MAQGMELRKLQRLVIDALEDVKAQDIVVFDTTKLTTLFDRVAIATGTSSRHAAALARSVADRARAAGVHVIALEGMQGGEWVLVDLGDIVVHVLDRKSVV